VSCSPAARAIRPAVCGKCQKHSVCWNLSPKCHRGPRPPPVTWSRRFPRCVMPLPGPAAGGRNAWTCNGGMSCLIFGGITAPRSWRGARSSCWAWECSAPRPPPPNVVLSALTSPETAVPSRFLAGPTRPRSARTRVPSGRPRPLKATTPSRSATTRPRRASTVSRPARPQPRPARSAQRPATTRPPRARVPTRPARPRVRSDRAASPTATPRPRSVRPAAPVRQARRRSARARARARRIR